MIMCCMTGQHFESFQQTDRTLMRFLRAVDHNNVHEIRVAIFVEA